MTSPLDTAAPKAGAEQDKIKHTRLSEFARAGEHAISFRVIVSDQSSHPEEQA
jgi:hypothetical protein